MDIGSESTFPLGTLSNFTEIKFVFDGVKCSSMEGLLQSFKYEDPEKQSAVCKLTGIKAKRKGKKRNHAWKSSQTLYWKGQSYPRTSFSYQHLLDRAFTEIYQQSEVYRDALEACGKAVFTHSMGSTNKSNTILTEYEFCNRLQKLKDKGYILKKQKHPFGHLIPLNTDGNIAFIKGHVTVESAQTEIVNEMDSKDLKVDKVEHTYGRWGLGFDDQGEQVNWLYTHRKPDERGTFPVTVVSYGSY